MPRQGTGRIRIGAFAQLNILILDRYGKIKRDSFSPFA